VVSVQTLRSLVDREEGGLPRIIEICCDVGREPRRVGPLWRGVSEVCGSVGTLGV